VAPDVAEFRFDMLASVMHVISEFVVAIGFASSSNKGHQHAIALPRLSFLRVVVFVIQLCHGIEARMVVDSALTPA
jgi:hypothetical protein